MQSEISNDVRICDSFAVWISQHWPKQYIEHCMQLYCKFHPKQQNETSIKFQRRKQRAKRNLCKNYNNCDPFCAHCVSKKKQCYFFYMKECANK